MAAASSTAIPTPPALPDGEDAQNWVLLDIMGYNANCPNATFAESTGEHIEVSFCTARPPHVSHFCVHCPELGTADFSVQPKVVRAEADLILFRLSAWRGIRFSGCYHDYFLYRAHPRNPSLDLLPHPHPYNFRDHEVALLSLGGGDDDDEYAVAALKRRYSDDNETEFNLFLYRSSKALQGWTSKVVRVAEPLRDRVCPVKRPARYYTVCDMDRSLYHETTKVITLGRGEVGWVDLWRGILVCDVLDKNPVLRDIPFPLPPRGNWEIYFEWLPYMLRDITVNPTKGCIKYVEMELRPLEKVVAAAGPPPDNYADWVRREPPRIRRPRGWKATTWTMPIPIASWEDWRPDCTLDVADIAVDPMHYVLLPKPRGSNPTEATILPRLDIGFPTMSMDDDVVYLLSKACHNDKMEVVIAVDVRKKTVQGVAKLVNTPLKDFTLTPICTSEISRYLAE